MQQGPCLSHCYNCPAHAAALAYVALAYALTSAGYLVLTRDFGTPLKDSYTEAQRRIARESSARRCGAFCVSGVVAVLALLAWRPLQRAR